MKQGHAGVWAAGLAFASCYVDPDSVRRPSGAATAGAEQSGGADGSNGGHAGNNTAGVGDPSFGGLPRGGSGASAGVSDAAGASVEPSGMGGVGGSAHAGRQGAAGSADAGEGGEAGEQRVTGGTAGTSAGGQSGGAGRGECAGVEGCPCIPDLSPAIPCGESDVGECRRGRHDCEPGTATYGACVGVVAPAGETCDGKDNDCDGYEDYEPDPETGAPSAVCACSYAPLSITEQDRDNRYEDPRYVCRETACSIGSDHALSMNVCHTCSDGLAWSTCRFSIGQDLSRFDASAGNSGIIEVQYCLAASAQAEIALWYGRSTPEYQRKKLVIARPGDAAGCRSAYFAPADACFSQLPGLDPSCVGHCGNDLPDACVFDYRSATLLLTVTGCNANLDETIRLLSVTHLDDACKCLDDAACTSGTRTSCQSVSGNLELCVSADCPGHGNSCTSIVNGVECHTKLGCLAGAAVCPTTGCQ